MPPSINATWYSPLLSKTLIIQTDGESVKTIFFRDIRHIHLMCDKSMSHLTFILLLKHHNLSLKNFKIVTNLRDIFYLEKMENGATIFWNGNWLRFCRILFLLDIFNYLLPSARFDIGSILEIFNLQNYIFCKFVPCHTFSSSSFIRTR